MHLLPCEYENLKYLLNKGQYLSEEYTILSFYK